MLARRYLRARSDERLVSLIGWSSSIGMAIGVMALIVVLSVMYGFDKELKERILGFSAHIDLQGGGTSTAEWHSWLPVIRAEPQVRMVAPYVSGQVLITMGPVSAGAILKGVVPEHEEELRRHIVRGRFLGDAPFELVLGKDLARKLGARVGDAVRLLTPVGGVSPAGMRPRMRLFHLVGIFDSGFYEYDIGLALTSLDSAQRLERLGDRVTGVEVRLHDRDRAATVAARLRAHLPDAWVESWMERHRSFFKALRTERITMGVILSLIVLVAVFNMVMSLVMVVMQRRKEVAVLRTIGAGRGMVMRIFFLMGTTLCGLGTAIGAVLGTLLAWRLEGLLAWLERVLGVTFISGDVYYIDHLPSAIDPTSIALVVLSSLLLGMAATLYPAWRAAAIPPADVLRYE
ncbi:MAG: lipoprotein-releasing ABC transporter permease subunit [Zetaproteobacteria bacterium]|nr:MAG: lipoprotein-releasing ABC transporter permease subunit [Zetaproteobacteria bacterium]